MKFDRLFYLTCFNLIIKIFSIIPEWNFEKASVNLFSSGNERDIPILETTKDGMYIKFYKSLSKINDQITYKNNLLIKVSNNVIYNGEVNFDQIESYYHLYNDQIICPKGKHHPTYFYNNQSSHLELDKEEDVDFTFVESGDWELRCFYFPTSSANYFLVFYLMNGQYNLYYKNFGTGEWKKYQSTNQFYDFKLSTTLDNGIYPMAYLVQDGNIIKIKGNQLSVDSGSGEIKGNNRGEFNLRNTLTNTRACFDGGNDHFYYLTYSSTSDFFSGYFEKSTNIKYLNVEEDKDNLCRNEISPFEFVDNVEINEIKFINNYKYAYYNISNPTNGKKYYGIIDISKNKVVFNTEKEILTFVPYPHSIISMLAITSDNAYEICVIKKDGACKDSWDCGSDNTYILNTEGNECGTFSASECADKIYLVRENMCSNSCDENIYVLQNNECGLCSHFYSNKPYKLINTSGCLEEIPDGAEIYKDNLKLLKCKSGYKLENDLCVVDCGNQCNPPTTITIPPTTVIIPPTTVIIPPTTVIIPPTTVIIPPTTVIIPPTTIITPPTTIIIPPTTIITPPTTVITPPTTIIIPPTTVITQPTTVIIPPTTVITPPTTIITPPTTVITPPTTVITPPTTVITPPTTVITPPTTVITKLITTILPNNPITNHILNCPEEKCLECNEESIKYKLYLSCNEALGYIKVNYTLFKPHLFDCRKKEDPLLKNFYYNETTKEYRPCYKTCKKCSIGGDAEKQHCLECESNYMFRPGDNPHNNCVAYSEFYYIDSYNQYKSLNKLNCPEEAKYLIKEKKSCIYDCKQDKEYKYLYNGQCLKECPSDTTNISFVCTERLSKAYLAVNDLYLDKNDDLKIVNNLVNTYISEFSYTSNHASLYENENYNILIYRSPKILNNLSLKTSKVDFHDCYDKVKTAYGIQEDLVITVVDTKNTNNPSSSYAFFHPKSGAKLDAENICKDEVIVVKENLTTILNGNDTKYELQSSLASQGINIFDKNDPFYTDLCFEYDNPKDRDMPLSDRITNVFPNITLCDDGCQMDGINLEDMTATCNCKFNDITNNEVINDNAVLDNMVGGVLDIINSSNILVVKCYDKIFKYFKNSIGGIFTTSIIALNLILTNMFFAKNFPTITAYIKSITYRFLAYLSMPYYPPKRASMPENKRRNTKKSSKRRKTMKLEKKEVDTALEHKYIITNEKEEINKKGKNNKRKSKSKTQRIAKKNNYMNNIYTNEVTDDYLDQNEIIKKFVEAYMETSPDDMEYDDAIKKDDRTFCEYFRENLREKQIIANTFIAEDPIKPRSIKIILFTLNLVLYFVINGLFISEDYISELYNINEEEENFFSFLPRSITRLIYTTIVSLIIDYITGFFFLGEKKVQGIFKRDKDNRVILKENIDNLINTLKTRYISFIIVVFVILLMSLYYLLCFNYVYPKTQIEWVKSSIAIIIIIQILSILKILLEAILRFLSFECESEHLFKFGKIFS